MVEKITEHTGHNIDKLVLIELRSPKYTKLPTDAIYKAARRKIGRPLTFDAAQRLIKSTEKNDFVLISTGFSVPPWLAPTESDGPPAAAAFARALSIGLGTRSLILTEENTVPVLAAAVLGAEMRLTPLETLKTYPRAGEVARGVAVESFPVDKKEAIKEASRILDELDPSAVVAIEKAGRNEKGCYHTARGGNISKSTAKIDYLVDLARERGILTIGCLDVGNEIGGGSIRDTVLEAWKFAKETKCSCQGTMASVVETDVPVVAANSAWGTYGIIACLAGLLDNDRVLHTTRSEKRIFEECVRAGMCDAPTLAPTLSLSGAPVDDYGHLIELLRVIVELARIKHTPHELRI